MPIPALAVRRALPPGAHVVHLPAHPAAPVRPVPAAAAPAAAPTAPAPTASGASAAGTSGRGAPIARELAAATPAERDRSIDALRVGSIAVVVLGHWLMATVTPAGEVGNALSTAPALPYLTWLLQVVPVFFLVGGFGHARALRSDRPYGDFVRGRVSRLLRPVAVLLAVWVPVAAVLGAAGLDRGLVGTALRTVPQPLWFLGVYLGVVGLAPLMWRWHRRHGAAVPVLLGAGAVAVDVLRFRYGHGAVGAVNLALVWLAVHQLGFLLADGRLTRRVGAGLAAAGGTALALLTSVGPYPVSMVGLPGDPVSNVGPPTVALLAQAVALTGLVVLVRPALRRRLADARLWTVVVAANGVVMTVFLWHLTALFALLALTRGPAAGTAAWWTTRPLWILALAVLTVPLVALFRAAERPVPAAGCPSARAAAGVAACALGLLGLSAVGLHGLLTGATATLLVLPLSAPAAIALVGAGCLALRPTRRR